MVKLDEEAEDVVLTVQLVWLQAVIYPEVPADGECQSGVFCGVVRI